jgi:methionyl-tRNA formyltransferase
MTKIKVAFFGTSDRSIPILDALKTSEKIELVLCVTKKDAKVGRHQDLKETEVKKWAKSNHIAVTTIAGLKGFELEALIEQLKTSNVEYGLVADFSFIIPYPLIEFFNGRLLNIHFSLLPMYRGASPVQFTILNGDQMAGITFMLVDKKLDAGKIIHQIGYKMSGTETSGELYNTLFELSAQNIEYVLENYANEQFKPRSQDEAKATYTYSPSHPDHTFIYKEDAQISWKAEVTKIYNMVRAFNPWPVAWTTAGDLENNKKLWLPKLKLRNGIDKIQKLKIYTAGVTTDDKLEIKELQIEGRNKMDWRTFENGYVTK